MGLWDFVQKYIKTRVDFDGVYGAQCVDLFRQYCADVLKIPHTGSVAGAKDLAEKYGSLPLEQTYFALVKDRFSARPGDAAVWGASEGNPYGHVALVLEARPGGMLAVFEQDGFSQTGAKIAERDSAGVSGYLRPRSGI